MTILTQVVVPSLITISLSIVGVMSTSTMMAFSPSAIPRYMLPASKCLSPHSISKSTMYMGTSVDVPFCAEAFTSEINDVDNRRGGNPWDVCIDRLDYSNKISGYDVTSARGWMEHIEQRDGPLYGVGAYTVLRCDAIYSKNECHWTIWGLDYHMSRLCSSYRMLVESHDSDCDSNLKESKLQTDEVITVLLEEAKKSLLFKEERITKENTNAIEVGDFARTLMVTILWTPPEEDANSKGPRSTTNPIIRGHAAFSGAARAQHNDDDLLSPPISACLAIPVDPTTEALAQLPRRHFDHESGREQSGVGARAKISSWCRSRRPLEEPTRFKVPGSGVGEVLLVRQNKTRFKDEQQDFIDSLEILEGLTSNLFVIYKDGTIRTAPDNVLSGYARHLVLEELNRIQSTKSSFPGLHHLKELPLDISNAPTIQDAKDGLWSEVFVTSSIRLIIPVERILIPPVGGMDSVTLWQSNCDERCAHPLTRSIWSAIHEGRYKSATSR